ncbi:unnamed protein product [Callosobruchus maculatus]|uniref:G-protein coupled receptors family 1 profile domain-containing protein n=1 Tax=Callosobruchus maculatus TaxID=64391 RepID=A0A653DUW6_CALMS|nr:unnamed protein product [Callosobruchus maculatus]
MDTYIRDVDYIEINTEEIYGFKEHNRCWSEREGKNLYAWLAIFVLPINSALNPVLYTLTTTIFKKQMSKMIHSCWNKRKRCDHQTASESALSLSLGGGTQSSSLLASKNSWKRSTAV